jgi:sugar lactone lactonase YvrE
MKRFLAHAVLLFHLFFSFAAHVVFATEFDVTTATFPLFNFLEDETSSSGISFNTDGTKMFIIGWSGDDVNEYALSSAYDVNTASYTTNFSISAQEDTPMDVTFNDTGSKMYVVGMQNDTVYQYGLTINFDLSTASYDSKSHSVNSETATPRGVRFNADGTRMLILGEDTPNEVYQYTLSTGFDVSTASYDSVSFSVNNESVNSHAMTFNDDGLKMYISDLTTNIIYQYTLTSAFDMSTASYASKSYDLTSINGTARGMTFSSDGNTLFILESNGGKVTANTLTSSFDISSASYPVFHTGAEAGGTPPIVFNDLGTKMYAMDYSTDKVYQYSLSSAYTINSASYDSKSFSVNSEETNATGIAFQPDGAKMFVLGDDNNNVNQYSLSTDFDVSTASYDGDSERFDVSSEEANPTAIIFNDDGTKMFIMGSTGDDINEYTLDPAYDVSTASYNGDGERFSVSAQETDPYALTFNDDGTILYVVGDTNDTVYQYDLTVAYDISTASYASKSLDLATVVGTPQGIAFNTSGTKMFIPGYSSGLIFEFSMAAAAGGGVPEFSTYAYIVTIMFCFGFVYQKRNEELVGQKSIVE